MHCDENRVSHAWLTRFSSWGGPQASFCITMAAQREKALAD